MAMATATDMPRAYYGYGYSSTSPAYGYGYAPGYSYGYAPAYSCTAMGRLTTPTPHIEWCTPGNRSWRLDVGPCW